MSLSLAQIADSIARRTVSPLELANAYLARIERLNPQLNAFVTVTADRARQDAKRLTERLTRGSVAAPSGAPIAHKDLFETAGILTTAGSRLFERHVPRRDAAIVTRLAGAGTVLLGKTNTHELGGGVTTINPFYGATRNPIDVSRIAGGSSGGSAAAVAARLAVAATGSDTGGSVRIPAAFCGCVGFKPTFGRISTAGLLGSCPTFDHVGLITRTVEDARLLTTVVGPGFSPALAGVDTGSKASLKAGPSRIGVPRRFFFDDLQPDVATAMENAIATFRALGADVRDRDLPIDDKSMARVFDPIVVSEIWKRFGDDWKRRPDSFSLAFAGFFASPPPGAKELDEAHRALRAFQAEVSTAFADIDVFLMPTVPITAPPIQGRIDGMKILRNTWPFNAARTPAISIPCGVDRDGLAIGLQLVANAGDDQRLLETARAFETAR